jgi:transcription initiation factor TFIIH subunit 2
VNWEEVHWRDAWRSSHCFACGKKLPEIPEKERWNEGGGLSGRFECPACRRQFCIDCDLFAHEVVHNCPGCQSGSGVGGGAAARADVEKEVDIVVEGHRGEQNGDVGAGEDTMDTG